MELTANMVVCGWWLWWAGGQWYPTQVHFASVTVTLAPVWRYFFWGYLLMFVVNIVSAAVNIFRPYWTAERAAVRLLSDSIAVSICWVMRLNIIGGRPDYFPWRLSFAPSLSSSTYIESSACGRTPARDFR
jgi:hypothetical protein